MTNIITASILLIVAIWHFLNERRFKRKKKQYIELDRKHARHINNILDYQLIMFGCIEKTDLYGAGIAHQYINEELKEIGIILDKKAQLIS